MEVYIPYMDPMGYKEVFKFLPIPIGSPLDPMVLSFPHQNKATKRWIRLWAKLPVQMIIFPWNKDPGIWNNLALEYYNPDTNYTWYIFISRYRIWNNLAVEYIHNTIPLIQIILLPDIYIYSSEIPFPHRIHVW